MIGRNEEWASVVTEAFRSKQGVVPRIHSSRYPILPARCLRKDVKILLIVSLKNIKSFSTFIRRSLWFILRIAPRFSLGLEANSERESILVPALASSCVSKWSGLEFILQHRRNPAYSLQIGGNTGSAEIRAVSPSKNGENVHNFFPVCSRKLKFFLYEADWKLRQDLLKQDWSQMNATV